MTTDLTLGQPSIVVKDNEVQPDDLRLHSVTRMIDILDKPALKWWAAEQTALAAVNMAGTLAARIQEDGQERVVDQLRRAMFNKPKGHISDAQFGTIVHTLCEQYALTGVRPDIVDADLMGDAPAARKCLDQFDSWLNDFQPEYQATEVVVLNTTYGYAGTSDAFLTLDGVSLVADYKSSKKSFDAKGNRTGLYNEIGLQLAAYRYAEHAAVWRPRRWEPHGARYYLANQAELDLAQPVPHVEGGIGIKITPDHCVAYPVRCDEEVFDSFLACMDVARYVNDLGPQVIGLPLVPKLSLPF